jgi:RHS repeat-associated protein
VNYGNACIAERLTFTSKPQVTTTYSTNFETASNTDFLNYSNTTFDLVDHTDAAGTTYQKSQLLNGGANGRVGLAKSIPVMIGDEITASAYGKYMNLGSSPNTNPLLANLASVFGVSSSSTGDQLNLYNGLNSYAGSVPTGDHTGDDEGAPKLFVTILFFDKNYNFVDAAWDQVSTVGAQTSGSVKQPPHDLLMKTVKSPVAGYAYIFFSNEHYNYVDAYFDDASIAFTPSPIIATDDYYPFGLTFNSYKRENSVENKIRFQGQEHVDDLGLNWDSFKWRNHQPEIGRFFGIDPIAEKYFYNSPYAFAENRVIDGKELEGLEWVNSTGQKVYDPKANDGQGAYTEHATRNERAMGDALRKTDAGRAQFNKLVNSGKEITVNINNGTDVKKDKEGNYVMGQTKPTDYDVDPHLEEPASSRKYEAKVYKAEITINVATIAAAYDDEQKTGDALFANVNLGKNVSFTDVLGAIFGHEIEHTTDKNLSLDLNDRSPTRDAAEKNALNVSDLIFKQLNELNK